jgi:hypothetical protein
MIKNIIAVYLIGLSVTSFALVLFIVLPYGNSVIAQQQNSANSIEHNNISNLPLYPDRHEIYDGSFANEYERT